MSQIDRQKDRPTLQPPFDPSVGLLCHPCITTVNLSYRFPIFETSATALCGSSWYMYNRHFCSHISIHFCRIHVKKQCMPHGFSFFCGRQKTHFFWSSSGIELMELFTKIWILEEKEKLHVCIQTHVFCIPELNPSVFLMFFQLFWLVF